jgi:DNA replication protein DnaC
MIGGRRAAPSSTSWTPTSNGQITTATVDRLLHHAHIVITEGTSHRLAEATTGKGVIPLT